MNAGDRYTAAWGEYYVLRVLPDRVVLKDAHRSSAVVIPTFDKLAADYTFVGPAEPPSSTETGNPAVLRAHGSEETPPTPRATTPRFPTRRALDALIPGTTYVSLPTAPTFYWISCLTRSGVEGFTGDSHACFIRSSLSGRLRCYACAPEAASTSSAARAPAHASQSSHSPAGGPGNDRPPPQGSPRPTQTSGRGKPPWAKDGRPIWEAFPAGSKRRIALEEWWTERSAIIEYDAGLSRPHAEHNAYQLLVDLCFRHGIIGREDDQPPF